MKIKVSEATGVQLDWMVASYADKHVSLSDIHWGNYSPSTDWAIAGPIIEREEIDLYCYTSHKIAEDAGLWLSEITGTKFKAKGRTPLIAAMRCYVVSKLSEEVEIPEDLK